jgi:serine protease Do
VGDIVLAIGDPFSVGQTVTMGIVSAVGREIQPANPFGSFIQTDAAINPGNSGGALINTRGELVGINTAIFSQSGGNMGIGFAVPSNMARSILEQLVQSGKVVRGWLGVSIQDLSPDLAGQFGLSETRGVLVSDVLAESPAKRAGLERGDIVIEFDGRPVENPTQLRNAVARAAVGASVPVKFIRDRQLRVVDIRIAEQPRNVAQADADEPAPTIAPASLLSEIEVRDLTDVTRRLRLGGAERGVVVARVRSGSAAEEAGIVEGDIILEVNRNPVANRQAYDRLASQIAGNQPVLLLVKRQDRTSYLALKP